MLIGLDPLLSPELLHALAAMGHGDRIVLVDANYPGPRGRRLIGMPGIGVVQALGAVLSVLPCDTFVPDPAAIMQVVGDAGAVPPVVAEMNAVLAGRGWPHAVGSSGMRSTTPPQLRMPSCRPASGGSTAISC